MTTLFDFYSSTAPSTSEGLVARIPAGITEKDELLRTLASALHFPEYFGSNWDSLDECLADLSWIADRRVQILHADLPLQTNPGEAKNYLKTLHRVLQEPSSKELRIAFPALNENAVRDLLKAAALKEQR